MGPQMVKPRRSYREDSPAPTKVKPLILGCYGRCHPVSQREACDCPRAVGHFAQHYKRVAKRSQNPNTLLQPRTRPSGRLACSKAPEATLGYDFPMCIGFHEFTVVFATSENSHFSRAFMCVCVW